MLGLINFTRMVVGWTLTRTQKLTDWMLVRLV
jgi:hypothetical protein